MISKELLSAVQEVDFVYIVPDGEQRWDTIKRKNDIVYELKGDSQYGINIHELAHKCKEWATKNDYTITLEQTVYVDALVYTATIRGRSYNIKTTKLSFYGTEPEAIFKACQWILENKEDN